MRDAETVVWHPVTTAKDDYGDGGETAATPKRLSALVAGRGEAEGAGHNAPGVIVGKQLYLLDAPGEPGPSDWFEVRGKRYDVLGEAHRWSGTCVEVAVRYVGPLP